MDIKTVKFENYQQSCHIIQQRCYSIYTKLSNDFNDLKKHFNEINHMTTSDDSNDSNVLGVNNWEIQNKKTKNILKRANYSFDNALQQIETIQESLNKLTSSSNPLNALYLDKSFSNTFKSKNKKRMNYLTVNVNTKANLHKRGASMTPNTLFLNKLNRQSRPRTSSDARKRAFTPTPDLNNFSIMVNQSMNNNNSNPSNTTNNNKRKFVRSKQKNLSYDFGKISTPILQQRSSYVLRKSIAIKSPLLGSRASMISNDDDLISQLSFLSNLEDTNPFNLDDIINENKETNDDDLNTTDDEKYGNLVFMNEDSNQSNQSEPNIPLRMRSDSYRYHDNKSRIKSIITFDKIDIPNNIDEKELNNNNNDNNKNNMAISNKKLKDYEIEMKSHLSSILHEVDLDNEGVLDLADFETGLDMIVVDYEDISDDIEQLFTSIESDDEGKCKITILVDKIIYNYNNDNNINNIRNKIVDGLNLNVNDDDDDINNNNNDNDIDNDNNEYIEEIKEYDTIPVNDTNNNENKKPLSPIYRNFKGLQTLGGPASSNNNNNNKRKNSDTSNNSNSNSGTFIEINDN